MSELSKEDYLKLKGLRAMHDDLEKRREMVWDAVADIFDGVIGASEDENLNLKDEAVDAMMTLQGLDDFLEDHGVEVVDDDEDRQ